jgi:hypothetical protein
MQLVINCSASFRSIPKILESISTNLECVYSVKIPHFTTIIRWLSQIGCHLLKKPKRNVCSSKKPWICIADHTIQVGTNIAFVVIGIPLKNMALGRALTLKDATVLSVVIKERWTGETVQKSLDKVFKKNGVPVQIVIDGASNLNKGVRISLDGLEQACHVTYDITHLIAKILKKKYQRSMKFLRMMEKLAIASKSITQTKIGYLQPPRLREKSRFLNLPKLATWLGKTLEIFHSKILKREEKKQIKKYFGWLWLPKWNPYIQNFAKEINAVKDVQKILKNTGITDLSYEKSCMLLSEIDDCDFTTPILSALKIELEYSQKVGVPALLTSDIIESLFGKYKTIAVPHKFSEINSTVLSMPCICEEITLKLIDQTFSRMKYKEVIRWTKRNIPQTLLSRRRKVFGSIADL